MRGYTRNLGYDQKVDFESISLAYGCGDLLSTTEDLYRWNCALLSGKVLGPEMLKKAWTPYRLPDDAEAALGKLARPGKRRRGFICLRCKGSERRLNFS